MESFRSFKDRVLEATGFELRVLPVETEEKFLQAGSIKVRRGGMYVLLTADAESADLEEHELAPQDFLVVDLRPRGSVFYAGNERYDTRTRSGCDARFSCYDCYHSWTEPWRIGTDPATVVRFCPHCGKEQVFKACSVGL